MSNIFDYGNKNKEDYWISISDLMSVLMMVFLFIAISYMIDVIEEKNKIKEIAVTYNTLQNQLYQDLENEFKVDLIKWNAELDKTTLSIKFKSPEVLFEQGKSDLKNDFVEILNDFFPRYMTILKDKKYSESIEEIRIEGHTSSEWKNGISENEAYFQNMSLSQDRTRTVLYHIITKVAKKNNIKWIKEKITANGLSSSRLIFNNDIEDKMRSRRVEFRVKTNAEQQIAKILSE